MIDVFMSSFTREALKITNKKIRKQEGFKKSNLEERFSFPNSCKLVAFVTVNPLFSFHLTKFSHQFNSNFRICI